MIGQAIQANGPIPVGQVDLISSVLFVETGSWAGWDVVTAAVGVEVKDCMSELFAENTKLAGPNKSPAATSESNNVASRFLNIKTIFYLN